MRDSEDRLLADEERNRLLEAIEEQARTLSLARGAKEHRLSDWLNAAEEVMPEVKKPAMKPMSAAMSSASPNRNLGSLLGMLVTASVAVALVAGGGFTYVKLTEQLSALQQKNQALSERVLQLEQAMTQLEQAKVPMDKTASAATAETIQQEKLTPDLAVSAAYLDARLQEQTQQLQAALDSRFQQLLGQLAERLAAVDVAVTAPAEKAKETATVPEITISAPTTPEVAAPSAPQAPQVEAPKPAIEAKVVSDKEQTLAETWLRTQPREHFILQLASSPNVDRLQSLMGKIKTKADETYVLPVTANGVARYILVYGSFATRNEARKAADAIRLDLGAMPWVRRVSDVLKLLEAKG